MLAAALRALGRCSCSATGHRKPGHQQQRAMEAGGARRRARARGGEGQASVGRWGCSPPEEMGCLRCAAVRVRVQAMAIHSNNTPSSSQSINAQLDSATQCCLPCAPACSTPAQQQRARRRHAAACCASRPARRRCCLLPAHPTTMQPLRPHAQHQASSSSSPVGGARVRTWHARRPAPFPPPAPPPALSAHARLHTMHAAPAAAGPRARAVHTSAAAMDAPAPAPAAASGLGSFLKGRLYQNSFMAKLFPCACQRPVLPSAAAAAAVSPGVQPAMHAPTCTLRADVRRAPALAPQPA